MDSSDNIYIADIGAQLIRKVISSSGLIITIAGIYDNKGYSGDYMAATSSALNKPSSVALDANGNLYIADRGNNLVRFVNVTTGIMSNAVGYYYEDDTYVVGDDDDTYDDNSSTNNGDDDYNVSDTDSLIIGLVFGLFLPLAIIYGCYKQCCASTTTTETKKDNQAIVHNVENPIARRTSVSTTELTSSKYKKGKCCQCLLVRESNSCKNGHSTCFECLLTSGISSYEQGTNDGLDIMCPAVTGNNANCNQYCKISSEYIPEYHCGILSKHYNRVLQQTNVRSRSSFSADIKRIEWREISGPITLIGQGAFSFVFKAVYSKQDVAVKILKKSTLNENYTDQDLLDNAELECKTILDVRDKMSNADCVVTVRGVCAGKMPPDIADAAKFPVFRGQYAVAIVLKFELGGTLHSKIHPHDKECRVTKDRIRLMSSKKTNIEVGSRVEGNVKCLDKWVQGKVTHVYFDETYDIEYDHTLYGTNQLTMKEKIYYLRGIARALHELHSVNQFHGDIKPENILLSADKPPLIRLTDFGFSVELEDAPVMSGASSTGMTTSVIGTAGYKAPELIPKCYADDDTYDRDSMSGQRPARESFTSSKLEFSRKTDSYAFAILCWEVLNPKGYYPYDPSKPEILHYRNVLHNWRPKIDKLSEVPKSITTMIETCWSVDRTKRLSALQCYNILDHVYSSMISNDYDIFFSHRWTQKNVLRFVKYQLTGCNYKVWYDEEDMGNHLQAEMKGGIHHSKVVLVALSKSYLESKNCKFELEYANKTGKRIVTILTEKEPWTVWTERDKQECPHANEYVRKLEAANGALNDTLDMSVVVGRDGWNDPDKIVSDSPLLKELAIRVDELVALLQRGGGASNEKCLPSYNDVEKFNHDVCLLSYSARLSNVVPVIEKTLTSRKYRVVTAGMSSDQARRKECIQDSKIVVVLLEKSIKTNAGAMSDLSYAVNGIGRTVISLVTEDGNNRMSWARKDNPKDNLDLFELCRLETFKYVDITDLCVSSDWASEAARVKTEDLLNILKGEKCNPSN